MMDLERIKALIELLAQSPLAELELIEGDDKVRLVKTPGSREGSAGVATAPMMPAGSQADSQAEAQAESPASAPGHAESEAHVIEAPMFGIVHLTPAPGEAPFVRVGDTVTQGQVLCTIEAMKMFNSIESEFTGTVLAILVNAGDEVESGQPLFRIGR
ncbi:acetyl-CoA carboxylase biotin carboxyl carrier protein [Caballeronia mineralivorans]|nr:acetyl-CoA carboxylase biotin carboxyl carrier protein [Caballeronia mineralivorans]